MIASTKLGNQKSPARRGGRIGTVVLLVVIAIVVATLLIVTFAPNENHPESASPSSDGSLIKEVAPSVTPPDDLDESDADKKDDEGWKPPKDAYKDERGIWRHQGGHRVYDPTRLGERTNLKMVGDKPSIFRHRSEREIERLLTLEPGQPMFGMRRYDARFEEDFLKSMEEPIVIRADDSEEDKALKQLMIDAKIEIMDRIRNGEKLGDILKETREELQRLAQYKRNLRKELLTLAKEGHAEEEDLDDFIKAANQMLEANGIDPLKNTGLLKRNLRFQTQRSIQ